MRAICIHFCRTERAKRIKGQVGDNEQKDFFLYIVVRLYTLTITAFSIRGIP